MRHHSFPAILLLLCLGSSILDAEEQDFWSRSHLYLGGVFAYNKVLGDFTGDMYLSGVGQATVVPRVDFGYGYGAVVGVREKSSAFELAFTRSAHSGAWGGTTYDSQLDLWSLDMRGFVFKLPPVEPFILLGVCVPILTVFQGATDGFVFGDAIYRGVGLDLGAGIDLHIMKHLSLVAQVVYRWAKYSTVEGTDAIARDITDSLSGNGLDFNALLLIVF